MCDELSLEVNFAIGCIRGKQWEHEKGESSMDKLRIVAVGAILILMGYVVLSPGTAYAPVPRLILFTLSSAAVAIFLGAEATTRLKLEWKGFAFVTAGVAALGFALLWFMTNAVKPELQVAIYQVVDENGRDVRVDVDGAVRLTEIPSGRPGFFLAHGSQLVITFPELVPEQNIQIRKTTDGPYYVGTVTYAGARKASLKLGTDLKK
jgi:hypothetical protein